MWKRRPRRLTSSSNQYGGRGFDKRRDVGVGLTEVASEDLEGRQFFSRKSAEESRQTMRVL